jgi:hypothetical protein
MRHLLAKRINGRQKYEKRPKTAQQRQNAEGISMKKTRKKAVRRRWMLKFNGERDKGQMTMGRSDDEG